MSLIDTKFSSLFFSSLFSVLLFDHSFSKTVCQMGLLPSVLCLLVLGTPATVDVGAMVDEDVPGGIQIDSVYQFDCNLNLKLVTCNNFVTYHKRQR